MLGWLGLAILVGTVVGVCLSSGLFVAAFYREYSVGSPGLRGRGVRILVVIIRRPQRSVAVLVSQGSTLASSFVGWGTRSGRVMGLPGGGFVPYLCGEPRGELERVPWSLSLRSMGQMRPMGWRKWYEAPRAPSWCGSGGCMMLAGRTVLVRSPLVVSC